jgi:hypothetical protein
MAIFGWIGLTLLVASILILLIHRIRLNHERDRPTLRHTLVASYLNSCRLPR